MMSFFKLSLLSSFLLCEGSLYFVDKLEVLEDGEVVDHRDRSLMGVERVFDFSLKLSRNGGDDEDFLGTIECDGMTFAEHLCPIDTDVKIKIYKTEGVTESTGHECSTFVSENYECVITFSDGIVQGFARPKDSASTGLRDSSSEPKGYIDFLVTRCGKDSEDQCARVSTEPGDHSCLSIDTNFDPSEGSSRPQIQERKVRDLRKFNLGLWEDCYPGVEQLNSFHVGVAIGHKLFHGDIIQSDMAKAMTFVEGVFADANVIYTQQLNLKHTIKCIEIVQSGEEQPWENRDCSAGLLPMLQKFEQNHDGSGRCDAGAWIYIDDCKRPGQQGTGAAYLSSVCTDYSEVAVNLIQSEQIFLTIAHELGHLLGASHTFQEGQGTTGGVMDYSKLLDGEYQFHEKYTKDELCKELTYAVENCPEYFDMVQKFNICGNGAIEPGEQCECGVGQFSCPCCYRCKLREEAKCDPIHNQCCQQDCQLKVTADLCSTPTSDGYCRNGVCTEPRCARITNGGFCGMHEDNSCKFKCSLAGGCYDMEGWFDVTNKPVNLVRSGSLCRSDAGVEGQCVDGACVV